MACLNIGGYMDFGFIVGSDYNISPPILLPMVPMVPMLCA